MKKMSFIVFVLLTLLSFACFSQDNGVYGGIQYADASVYYFPQHELNQVLESNGYPGFQDFIPGIIVGGGGFINNLFIGGWGCFDIIPVNSVNTSAGMRLSGGIGGRGGFEIGYLIFYSKMISIVPTVNLIWGGNTYTFNKTVDFEDYINNPSTFEPSFGPGYMSIGGMINIFSFPFPIKWIGINIKIGGYYSMLLELEGQHFTNAPGLNPFNMVGSLGFVFGSMNKRKESRVAFDEVPER